MSIRTKRNISFLLIATIIMVCFFTTGCGNSKSNDTVVDRVEDVQTLLTKIDKKIDELSKVDNANSSDEKLSEIEDKIDALQNSSNVAGTVAQNSDKSVTNDTVSAYMEMKFPKDGKTYTLKEKSNTKIYKDVYCSVEIEAPHFSSNNIDKATAANGLGVYCMMTIDNQIVYSTEKPILVEVK